MNIIFLLLYMQLYANYTKGLHFSAFHYICASLGSIALDIRADRG